jgi:hypothetical protein
MKKQMMILPSMLLVSILAACGAKGLTTAQAVEVAKKIQAKHADTSFAYPQDKLTLALSTEENGATKKAETRVVKDTYYYTAASDVEPATSSSSAVNENKALYLYSKESKYISATDDGTTKTYSELTASVFATEISYVQAASLKIATQMAEGFYTILDDFIKSNEASSSSTSSSSAATSDTTYTYSSTGDGNLSLIGKTNEDDSQGKGTSEETITFDNYLPVSLKATAKGEVNISSSKTSIDGQSEYSFGWNKCETVYPDLSKFTKQ